MLSTQQSTAQCTEDNKHLCLGLLFIPQTHFLVMVQYKMTGYKSLVYMLKTYNAWQADTKVL